MDLKEGKAALGAGGRKMRGYQLKPQFSQCENKEALSPSQNQNTEHRSKTRRINYSFSSGSETGKVGKQACIALRGLVNDSSDNWGLQSLV